MLLIYYCNLTTLRSYFASNPVGNMALYFECRINKNTLLQTVFWRFCPLRCKRLNVPKYCWRKFVF